MLYEEKDIKKAIEEARLICFSTDARENEMINIYVEELKRNLMIKSK